MSDVRIEFASSVAYWAHCSACGWSGHPHTEGVVPRDPYSAAYEDKLGHQSRCQVLNRRPEATP